MNKILLENVSKKFGNQPIFSGVNLQITQGEKLSIIGYNGSGKSTLLQLFAGYVSPSSGSISYFFFGNNIPPEEYYKYVAFAAPYLDLFEEFTALETVAFYRQFKPLPISLKNIEILEIAKLTNSIDKPVKNFSSGMKQRLKLVLCLLSEVQAIFLDEPVSNLDKPGIRWFHDLIDQYLSTKILVVSSNEIQDEISFCNRLLKLEEYKK